MAQNSEFKFTGLTVSGTTYTKQLPDDVIGLNDIAVGASRSISASTDVGWRKATQSLFASAEASSLFGMHLEGSSPKSWNQSGSASLGRAFARRWHFSVGGNGSLTTFDESLFVPSQLERAASTNASFGDLATAVLQGRTTDPELVNVGALTPDLGQERFLFGRRTAVFGVQAGLAYSASRRLSYTFDTSLTNIRHIQDQNDQPGLEYLSGMSSVTGAGVEYSLSPKTQIGAGVTFTRGGTSLHDLGRMGMATRVGVNHTLRRHWFFNGSIGLSVDGFGPERSQFTSYSGGAGFRAADHTFLGTYGHQIENPYLAAIGSGTFSDAISARWDWSPIRSNWSVGAGFNDGTARFIGLTPVETRSVDASVKRNFGEHYSISANYGMSKIGSKRYVQEGKRYTLDESGFRASFHWSPWTPRVRR